MLVKLTPDLNLCRINLEQKFPPREMNGSCHYFNLDCLSMTSQGWQFVTSKRSVVTSNFSHRFLFYCRNYGHFTTSDTSSVRCKKRMQKYDVATAVTHAQCVAKPHAEIWCGNWLLSKILRSYWRTEKDIIETKRKNGANERDWNKNTYFNYSPKNATFNLKYLTMHNNYNFCC